MTSTAPLRFDEYQRLCLYHPEHGYYSRGGRAGRRGADFITSPEVGALFGAVLANVVDSVWRGLGRPVRFDLVEVGAGRGALMRSILDAAPQCSEALLAVCVEQSATLREQARELLGDRAEVLAELPARPIAGVILANELLDNLVVRLIERTPDGWVEVWVGDDGEVLRSTDLDPEWSVPVGTRLPVQAEAAAWVASAIGALGAGRLIAIDYGVATTRELTDRPWLRTYAEHRRGTDPYQSPGDLDITCDVAFDQLPGSPTISTQAEFLVRHGIEPLVADARATWHERAHLGDLPALRARSRVGEAEALCDPGGLGAFLVAEWNVAAPDRMVE